MRKHKIAFTIILTILIISLSGMIYFNWQKAQQIELLLQDKYVFEKKISNANAQVIQVNANKDELAKKCENIQKELADELEKQQKLEKAIKQLKEDREAMELNDCEMIVDKRLEIALVETIIKHFKAIENGEVDAFKSTIIEQSMSLDYLMNKFEAYRGKELNISKIVTDLDPAKELPSVGGFFVGVDFHSMDGGFWIAVTKEKEKWIIYDYD